MTDPLLDVRNLTKHYPVTEGMMKREVGRVRAVDGISFTVDPGETVGLVGESGCGKSTAATSLLRLEEPTSGEVYFDGEDILTYDKRQLKRFRRRAQIIFQDPTSSFDPRMSIGESVAEPLRVHGMKDGERRRRIVQDLLERVGLSADHYDRYPHEFSGGQKQRIAIARALILNPDLIVADEPVSALDVSIQSEIIRLLNDVKESFGLSMLFISHDLGVVREVCDRVAVMYLGEIVEVAPTETLFTDPQHPYTEALLSSIPRPDPRKRGEGIILTGDVPSPSNPPSGCRFHTRCPKVIPPPEFDFAQSDWRALMDVKQRVASGNLDVDAVREFLAGAGGDPDGVPVDDIAAEIRSEFDVPAEFDDDRAEDRFAAALDFAIQDEFERAQEVFAEAFPTVCEREVPSLEETPTGNPAACHLVESLEDEEEEVPALDD